MLLSNRLFALVICLFSFSVTAQDCDLNLSGNVKDLSSGDPISYATIYLKETQAGDISDSLGTFNFQGLCPGKYHLAISHIGCATQEVYLILGADTTMVVELDHDSKLLHVVPIIGSNGKPESMERHSISSEDITQNTDKDLATMLEKIPGVSSIRNGSGISKPVVHGLYGNRLAILNNGIAQSGQQWGVDHSPEIDPLVANRITVVKGVGVLEYPGNSLGSVILVEPKKIDHEPHLHGEGRYFFESNGRGNGFNLELQQHSKLVAWRLVGTLKKSGDNKTSKYFLRNTGGHEANVALQLERSWKNKWFSDLYLSSFNAEFGVLRGSHIGNLTDLQSALTREVPFYTSADFSSSLDAPKQKVNHHLLKFHTKYRMSDKQWLEATYGGQYNLRKEFDVRRGGRTERPALSLEQFSHYVEGKYLNHLPHHWDFKTGVQLQRVDNVNLPETGILPLIPNYISNELGFFGFVTKEKNKTTVDFGLRYDVEERKVATISTTLPREILRFKNTYKNFSAMAGMVQEIGENWKATYNLGYTARNPEVNELYSNGLHQGVSGIEEGDPNLVGEVSLKNTLSLKGNIKDKWTVEGLFYLQNVSDYIYLKPQDEIRLTIRGAFPVFKYEQTDARLTGFDFATTYSASDRFNIVGKYSFLVGNDLGNDLPLIYMPSNNLYGELNHQWPKWGKYQSVEIQLNNRFVFKQNNLLASQDFVGPPNAYNLVGLKISAERQLRRLRLKMMLKAENLLNETYRDYLNRQRYFADGLGFNLIAGLNVSF